MLTKWKGLSKQVKIALGAGLACLAALGIGVAAWQPWNQKEPAEDLAPPPQQQEQIPQEKTEKGPTLKVGSEEIPCSVYTAADGWTLSVPEGWEAANLGDNGVVFSSTDGAQLSVLAAEGSGGFGGDFVNLSTLTGDERTLLFYTGTDQKSYYVYGDAKAADWNQYSKLFTAMARTLTLPGGADAPFAESFVLPQEPDWQETEGLTVLFLDKDGFVLDEKVQEAVEEYMRSWPVEDRTDYTGQYRVNRVVWAGSFAGLAKAGENAAEGYVDIFRADVQYRTAEGAANEGVEIVDGWASREGGVYLAVFHDGGSVEKTLWRVWDNAAGWPALAAELV